MVYRSTRWLRSTVSCIPGSLYQSHITSLVGTDNFAGNVKLEELQLPSDNPAGGINFITITQLNNPRFGWFQIMAEQQLMDLFSPFALDLGTVVFDLSYQDVYLGSGSGPNTNLVFFISLWRGPGAYT